MKITAVKDFSNVECLVLCCFSDFDLSAAKIPGIIFPDTKKFLDQAEWKWEKSKHLRINLINPTGIGKLLFVGLGDSKKANLYDFVGATKKVIAELKALNCKNAAIYVDDYKEKPAKMVKNCIAETAILETYAFNKYKSDSEESKLAELMFIDEDGLQESFESTKNIADSVNFAKDLVNEPANELTPQKLADHAREMGKEIGFEVDIMDEKKICELGMEAYWSVAKGSDLPPRLIVMRYKGDPDNAKDITGLVGKGLTYDSGGYAIKPASGMVTMKGDMGGSAAVIGAMCAIAKNKLKKNVIAVVAACENMISGRAYRNGDIIGSMAGKKIEILNTDAEGRLTLIDAVTYAIKKEKVSRVVDIATLTGAALVALGKIRMGAVSNNDDFFMELEKASDASGEKIWRLPHDDEYRELLKSDIADIKNVGGREAGTITAGLFIRDFVEDLPWIHLDIAGTSWKKHPTGSGVSLLYHMVKN